MGQSIKDIWPDGGSPISLTTTPSYLWRDSDAQEVEFFCDADFRINIAPRIKQLLFYDDTDESYTDYSSEAQDGDADVAIVLSSMQTADRIYVRTEEPILGIYFDILATNDAVSVMTINYWKDATPDAWADTGNTDGTDVGGDTLKQDGLNYWTAPSDEIIHPAFGGQPKGYWYQITISGALDSAVELVQAMALSKRSSSQAPTVVLKASTYHSFKMDTENTGGFQIDVSVGTAELQVIWTKH